jgi:hypothetical protein
LKAISASLTLLVFLKLYIHRKHLNCFCDVIFDTFYDRIGKTSKDVKLDLEEWMAVLKIAKKWKLTMLSKRASANSDKDFGSKTSIEKILYAKKYNMEKWLKEGCREIGSRTKALTRDEKARLDLPTYVGLLELRDRVTEWVSENVGTSSTVHSRENFSYDVAFGEIFASGESPKKPGN